MLSEMDQNNPSLERAFELARSGHYRQVKDLKRAVVAEGYARDQLEGRALSRQLNGIMKKEGSRRSLLSGDRHR